MFDPRESARSATLSEWDDSVMASELRRMLDALLAARAQLSEGVLPRAARITGTSQQFAQVLSHVDLAIRTARSLLDEERCQLASVRGERDFDALFLQPSR